MGAKVTFDDHNQGGKLVLIEGVADRKVKILKEMSLRKCMAAVCLPPSMARPKRPDRDAH